MDNLKKCDIIIFGAHGDLALRKLMPALYHLHQDGHIDESSRIIGVSREKLSTKEYSDLISEKFQTSFKDESYDEKIFQKFISTLIYISIDLTNEIEYKKLSKVLKGHEDKERINYLSTAPSLFGIICKNLAQMKLIVPTSRVVLEKPIGNNLASSQVINDEVSKYFEESAIYRIDHYLGKDTVQNILALRFSNMLFTPIWNTQYIDHIQITVAESVGLEGRWDYYNNYGAMRDMIQNHLLQLLCLITMEPPSTLDGDRVRDEKLKVIRALRFIEGDDLKLKTVRGQYGSGVSGDKSVPGYLEEDGGNSNSDTETFVAIRADIDNWRWHGVPIYLRTGKRMSERYSEIVIDFKDIPHSIFPKGGVCIDSNKLVIRLQPDESISMFIMNKVPGLNEGMKLRQVELDLNISEDAPRSPDAYEHLLLDVVRSNPTLFMRRDEVEAAWVWADKIIEGWKSQGIKPKSYKAGTCGPSSSMALIERDGRSWYEK
ncbi:glucose-6-phosphate dehydrogenase [Sulfurimonas aquatica]|uniref:Glucose-6-phosphate 1-dehydrogenase n=1 Tax=Sulfurimonas aquatica TaxID=2672570 RepID=A0A975GDK4_9BACT|nr:glucose-6-phosphate dehydrogenase [Sulfurimonas aquatica]QSZ42682.1 glucose-6-phosphate dehydrogenase [Sulfurimonas aquatica]